jgi:UDP-N-acetylmuramoyl-tripeptide--D-alanyl-D-alanine ligase
MAFKLHYQNTNYDAFVPGFGEHQVNNAMSAIAAVHFVGVGIQEAIDRLSIFKIAPRHLELFKGIDGSLILDDTFLTNPTSIEAAFKVLKDMSKTKKSIAVLGEINRLGDHTESYHKEVGEIIASIGVDVLITVGANALDIGKTAKEKGAKWEFHHFDHLDGVEELIKSQIVEETIVLIKGYGYDLPLVRLANRLKE